MTGSDGTAEVTRRTASAEIADHASIPVDPSLTHKRAESNSWLTSYRVRDENELEASFGLPRSDAPPQLPALMEVWRQAGLVFAHKVLHVPMDYVFALTSISLHMRGPGLSRRTSQHGIVHISDCVFSVTRSAVRAAEASARMMLESGEVLEGRLSAQFLPARTYARLRSAETQPEGGTGASKPSYLPTGPAISALAARPLIEPFYDHEHDHVTAMSLVSAIERSVAATSNAVLRGLGLEFQAYVDAHPLPEIPFTSKANGQFMGTVLQQGRVKASFSGFMSPALPADVQ